MSHPVVHFEVQGADRVALQQFYGDLFGWQMKDEAAMNYTLVEKEENGIAGGIGQNPDGTSMVTFYVSCDDIQATLDKAVELGGTVLMPVMELPMVTLAMFADPEGHPIGLVTGM